MFQFFFFNDTATTEIYTLSLHDALPICLAGVVQAVGAHRVRVHPEQPGELAAVRGEHRGGRAGREVLEAPGVGVRSEEHTSELQSRQYLVCRLLLEKKKHSYCLIDLSWS